MDTICTIILAAGKGTRMLSTKPKVLHEILGQPLIWYPLAISRHFGEDIIVVIGHGREEVGAYLARHRCAQVVQDPPLGTGHAVLQTRAALERTNATDILIIPGDMPLIDRVSVGGLIQAYQAQNATMGILTARLDDPAGYGRIVRDAEGRIKAIVEENDAKPGQKKIKEVNTAVYMVKKDFLLKAVGKLTPNNAKGELYLTDIVKMAGSVVSAQALDSHEGDGINSRDQLAAAAATMQQRINTAHMRAGVTLVDPKSTYIGPLVKIASDVEIWPGVHILGQSNIKGRVRIMPGAWIKDATIGPESSVGQHCIIEGATVSPGAAVAPHTVLAI